MTRATTKRHAGRRPSARERAAFAPLAAEATKRGIRDGQPVAWLTLGDDGLRLCVCSCDPPCVDAKACPAGDT